MRFVKIIYVKVQQLCAYGLPISSQKSIGLATKVGLECFLLGPYSSGTTYLSFVVEWIILEQVLIAALDVGNLDLAQVFFQR